MWPPMPCPSFVSICSPYRNPTWIKKAPSSILFSTPDGLKKHWSNATSLFNSSLFCNTLKAYNATCRAFYTFQTKLPNKDPSDIKYVLSFISYCNSDLKLSYNSIRHSAFPLFAEPRKSVSVFSSTSETYT